MTSKNNKSVSLHCKNLIKNNIQQTVSRTTYKIGLAYVFILLCTIFSRKITKSDSLVFVKFSRKIAKSACLLSVNFHEKYNYRFFIGMTHAYKSFTYISTWYWDTCTWRCVQVSVENTQWRTTTTLFICHNKIRKITECNMVAGCQKGTDLSSWDPWSISEYNINMNIKKTKKNIIK